MKYNPDSYLLYGSGKSPRPSFPIRIRVTMTDTVNGSVLDAAVQKAIRRYPYFAVRVEVKDESYILTPNGRPVTVCPTRKKTPPLGSEEVNGHLAFVDYEGCDIYFNLHHTLSGALGMMEWVKTTLYQYVCDAYGVQPVSDGIHTPDSPLMPGETDFPDVEKLPQTKPESWYKEGGYNFHKEYILGALIPFYHPVYYTFDIPQEAVLNYAKQNSGSPSSVFPVLMMKAVRKVIPGNTEAVTAGISHNYRADAGCPDTYRDLTYQIYAHYTAEMSEGTPDSLNAFTRQAIKAQCTPEYAAAELRRILKGYAETDALPSLSAKRKFNERNSRYISAPRATFTVSYLGRVEWGCLRQYVRSAYVISEGHFLTEILSVGEKFCVCFSQVTQKKKFADSFRQALEEAKIPFEVRGPFRKNLPDTVLPDK